MPSPRAARLCLLALAMATGVGPVAARQRACDGLRFEYRVAGWNDTPDSVPRCLPSTANCESAASPSSSRNSTHDAGNAGDAGTGSGEADWSARASRGAPAQRPGNTQVL